MTFEMIRPIGRAVARIAAVSAVAWTTMGSATSLSSAQGFITRVDPVGGTTSLGYAINQSGAVAGRTTIAPWPNTTTHAFGYSPGGAGYDLGTLTASGTSTAYAINSSGQIVGSSYSADQFSQFAFLYTPSPGGGATMTNLGNLGFNDSVAYGLNDNGQVVGSSLSLSTYTHAFLYTDGVGMTDLGTLGGAGHESHAYAINASGQVTGYSGSIQLRVNPRAFLYTNSTMYDLGTLGLSGNDSYSIGKAINVHGQVTGVSDNHAFRYSGSPTGTHQMLDLGTLGEGSEGWGIDSDGNVVGWIYYDDPEHSQVPDRAFLFTDHMIDLDAWLDVASPEEGAKWYLQRATGITDSGLIVGYGTYEGQGTRTFILDASSIIPEPACLSPLAVAGAALLARRRRTA